MRSETVYLITLIHSLLLSHYTSRQLSAMCESPASLFFFFGFWDRLGGPLVNLWSKVNRHATEP